jgi:hypothetical protein
MNPEFRHIDVPYRSQWVGPEHATRIVQAQADPCLDPGWPAAGFAEADDYRFWSRRICGLACLQSMLAHWRRAPPNAFELLQGALAAGAYVHHPDGRVDGLLYAPFGRWVRAAFGLEVEVLPRTGIEALAACVGPGAMAIASVSSEIRFPDRPNSRRGGHLVLLHGRDARGVWFHNPSGVTGTQCDAYLAFAEFERFFAHRGMAVRLPNPLPPPPEGTP